VEQASCTYRDSAVLGLESTIEIFNSTDNSIKSKHYPQLETQLVFFISWNRPDKSLKSVAMKNDTMNSITGVGSSIVAKRGSLGQVQ
jgi:hypothetical protein